MEYKLITFKQLQFFCFNAQHGDGIRCKALGSKNQKCKEKICPYWDKLDFGAIKKGKITEEEL